MPTNKLLEDKLNEWAKNWRRQQEEMSRQSQYQTQNQTPYNTSASNWQQTPYQPQAQSFAAQPAAPQQPQQVSAQTSVLSPEIANAAFQKGFASKQKSGFPLKNTVTQAMSNMGNTTFYPVYGGAQMAYKAGENIGKALYKTGEKVGKVVAAKDNFFDALNMVNRYPFQKDDVTMNNIDMTTEDWKNVWENMKKATNLYFDYQPLKYNDKYKHSTLNYKLAQQGNAGAWVADLGSRLKETWDIASGGNTLLESYADMKANLLGRKLGYNNPNTDSDKILPQYYPKYYPKK